MFGATFISIVPRDFVELAPLSSVLLRLPITLVYWWLGLAFLGLAILDMSFSLGFRATLTGLLLRRVFKTKKSLILLLELVLDLDNISVSVSQ
jgi:hypothetical protein